MPEGSRPLSRPARRVAGCKFRSQPPAARPSSPHWHYQSSKISAPFTHSSFAHAYLYIKYPPYIVYPHPRTRSRVDGSHWTPHPVSHHYSVIFKYFTYKVFFSNAGTSGYLWDVVIHRGLLYLIVLLIVQSAHILWDQSHAPLGAKHTLMLATKLIIEISMVRQSL